MPPFGLPTLSSEPVLFLPLWLGTLRDSSSNGNHATAVSPLWWQSAGYLDYLNSPSSGYISVAASSTISSMTSGTVFVGCDIRSQITSSYVLWFSSLYPYWYLINGNVVLYDGSAFSLCPCNVVGAKSMAVTIPEGTGKPEFFSNGLSDGFGGADVTVNWPENELRLFGVDLANGLKSPVSFIAIYPSVLPASEILLLQDYSLSLATPRRQWPGCVSLPGRPPLQTGDPVYVANISSARVSLKDETAGTLSNTTFTIQSGTWRENEDLNGRFVECLSAGKITDQVLGASSAITKKFEYTGTASITKTNNQIEIDASTGARITAIELAAA